MKHLPHHHGDEHSLAGIKEALNNDNNYQGVAKVFEMLADGTRVKLFWLLCHHEDCVLDIAALMGMTSSAVIHHLKILRDNDLVISRRIGKEVYYRSADNARSDFLHKMIEDLIDIECPEDKHACCKGCEHEHNKDSNTSITNEQRETIHGVHDYLASHLDQRITIEDLSHHFAMNSTSIKSLFKSIYGNSVAAHIKEHRMEQASRMLTDSDMSMAQIAESIGYTSQSKFTTAFKEYYGVLPTTYRKNGGQV